MSKIRIKTSNKSRWGKTRLINNVEVSFCEDGFAEVEEHVAIDLSSSFHDIFLDDENIENVEIEIKKDEATDKIADAKLIEENKLLKEENTKLKDDYKKLKADYDDIFNRLQNMSEKKDNEKVSPVVIADDSDDENLSNSIDFDKMKKDDLIEFAEKGNFPKEEWEEKKLKELKEYCKDKFEKMT